MKKITMKIRPIIDYNIELDRDFHTIIFDIFNVKKETKDILELQPGKSYFVAFQEGGISRKDVAKILRNLAYKIQYDKS